MSLSTINHKFESFRNKYVGESCILLAAGPSLNKFQLENFKSKYNVKYVCGVNSVLLYTKKLDFYFFGDKNIPEQQRFNLYLDKISLLSDQTSKFAAIYRDGIALKTQVSPQFAKNVNAIGYDTTLENSDAFSDDISKYRMSPHSIAFQSMQFLLFCGFKTIYLVGCDCGTDGRHSYFKPTQNNEKLLPHNNRYKQNGRMNKLINLWKNFKTFTDKDYPETKIFSVNPLGLKELFYDINFETSDKN